MVRGDPNGLPGCDFSGIVEEVGSRVTKALEWTSFAVVVEPIAPTLKIGLSPNSSLSYEKRGYLHEIPENVSSEEAAT
jgi:NADPH:quinone reductase-like Zn-dependent oxidoreductase